MVPAFLAATARAAQVNRDQRVLVVIQLDGGNDGVNTVVPFRDEGYAKYRKALRLPADRLLKVTDSVGLHPSLEGLARLLERGELAIVQGVGYPNPSRSHFRSMAVWHTARIDPEEHAGPGWLGRAFDEERRLAERSHAYFLGAGQPAAALVGRRSAPATLERVEDLALKVAADPRALLDASPPAGDLTVFVRRSMLDAYACADQVAQLTRRDASAERYPDFPLAQRLATIARLLKAGAAARVFYTQHGSYDTHAAQLNTHASLLRALSGSIAAFQADLAASGLAKRVVVLCFSEFGRQVAENGSRGTDHGAAGPVLLAGQCVKPGLIGPTASLLDLEGGGVKPAIDFRSVYAAVLGDWLRLPTDAALGGRFAELGLFPEA